MDGQGRKRDRGGSEGSESTGSSTDVRRKRTAASHGNFISYYNIRNQSTADVHGNDVDARVTILLSRLESPIFGDTARIHRLLDVGCNEGRVGIELGESPERQSASKGQPRRD